MKKLFLFSLLGIIILISSCSPDLKFDTIDTSVDETITMENLVVSPDFDWKTYNDVKITLKGNSNDIIEVVSLDGSVYQKAFLATNETYEMKLALPTHEKSIRLLYNNQDVPIDISSGNANYTFE